MARRARQWYRQNGWARGLIHFHSRFSDGWATIRQAAEIAVANGFDFLIVTDHLRNLKLFTHRSLDDYIAACDRATEVVGIPTVPGGEIEVPWDRPNLDRSEAHTIVFSIRELAADPTVFDWVTPEKDPFWAWPDDDGNKGTISAVQKMLSRFNLPRAASHQFQHSYLGVKRGEHPDFRYDLLRIFASDYLDFFYSGALDATHEPEDIELIMEHSRPEAQTLKAIYASCDYHIGPEVLIPGLAILFESIPSAVKAYSWAFRTVTSGVLRWLAGNPEAAVFPLFAEEQLTHATYVHLGQGSCTEANILDALRRGRTCVTRGTAEFAFLFPRPDLGTVHRMLPELHLELPRTWIPGRQRPHHVVVLRDGQPIHWETYDIRSPDIGFSWYDKQPLSGSHVYQVYVPSKFLSSPIQFSRP